MELPIPFLPKVNVMNAHQNIVFVDTFVADYQNFYKSR
jgi:hypothetical protein